MTAVNRARAARAAALAAALAAVVSTLAGCHAAANVSPETLRSENEQFCRRLREDYRLTELRSAIERNDTAAVGDELRRFRDLALYAPPSIRADMTAIASAVDDSVRAVTATGADGGQRPVDLSDLDGRIMRIGPSAQAVAAFADRECGIQLQS